MDEGRLRDAMAVGGVGVDALVAAAYGAGAAPGGVAFGQTPMMASPTAYSPEAQSVYGGASPGPQFSPTGGWTPDAAATPAFSPGPHSAAFYASPGAMSPAGFYAPSPGDTGYAARMSPGYTPDEFTPTSPAVSEGRGVVQQQWHAALRHTTTLAL